MFGRSASLAALTCLALLASPAFAKTQNFASGSPFGLGLVLGAEGKQKSDFPDGERTYNSNYSRYFNLEPFIDLVNLVVRAKLGWHFYPVSNGRGLDTIGSFAGNSSASSFDYGARFLLSPYQNQSLTQRFYLALGIGQSNVKLKNERTYLTGAQTGQVNHEQLSGKGTELTAGLGYEFFLLQNYSFQLEAGYAQRTIDTFTYGTDTDLTGAPASGSAKTNAGDPKTFHVNSAYLQAAFNLNF